MSPGGGNTDTGKARANLAVLAATTPPTLTFRNSRLVRLLDIRVLLATNRTSEYSANHRQFHMRAFMITSRQFSILGIFVLLTLFSVAQSKPEPADHAGGNWSGAMNSTVPTIPRSTPPSGSPNQEAMVGAIKSWSTTPLAPKTPSSRAAIW